MADGRVVAGKGQRALKALVGARFTGFDRRGKHLLLTLQQSGKPVGLWSHLGMSGKWLLRQPGDEPPRWSRVTFTLDRGQQLHFVDLRLFGRMRVVPRAAFAEQPVLVALGPDPLHDGIDRATLSKRLARSSKPIKPLLLDQTLLAGVGNIQASEALYRAAIDPRRPARDLTAREITRLARAIRASIDFTLRHLGKQIDDSRGRDISYVEEPAGLNPFLVYERAGEPCRRCRRQVSGAPPVIQRLVQAARSTYLCPRHQR